jgi:hypothetical protein
VSVYKTSLQCPSNLFLWFFESLVPRRLLLLLYSFISLAFNLKLKLCSIIAVKNGTTQDPLHCLQHTQSFLFEHHCSVSTICTEYPAFHFLAKSLTGDNHQCGLRHCHVPRWLDCHLDIRLADPGSYSTASVQDLHSFSNPLQYAPASTQESVRACCPTVAFLFGHVSPSYVLQLTTWDEGKDLPIPLQPRPPRLTRPSAEAQEVTEAPSPSLQHREKLSTSQAEADDETSSQLKIK